MAIGSHRTLPDESPAAALAAALLLDGVDLNDGAAIEAWMQEFNERPYEERARVLTDAMVEQLLPSAAVVLPEEALAAQSAATSPLLTKIRLLVEFIGEGRKLTQTGNVTLADARELVTLLDTRDRLDEQIGDRTFKTKSASELPHLGLIVRVAKKARLVRTAKGKLLVTKAGRDLGKDPLGDLAKLVWAIDQAGMCSAYLAAGHHLWTSLAPYFDGLFVPLTTRLITDTAPVPFDELVEHAFEQFDTEVDLGGTHWNRSNRRRLVEGELRTAIEVLETAGIVTWSSRAQTTADGITKRTGGTVTTSPGGQWALYHHLSETHGVRVTVALPAQHTGADFETLFAACERDAPGDFGVLMREVTAWVDERGVNGITELAGIAQTTSEPALHAIAMATIGASFGPDAEPQVRQLLNHPRTRGGALVWLVDHGCEPADVLLDKDPAVLAEILTITLVQQGPADLLDLFNRLGGPDSQTAILQQLWRQTHPGVPEVLDTLGRHHPERTVAKAARKAAMQHATRLANPPRH